MSAELLFYQGYKMITESVSQSYRISSAERIACRSRF